MVKQVLDQNKMKIRFMDIQFHNKCNRSCWFCPPQCKNKPKKNSFMQLEVVDRIINFIKYLDNNNLINGIMSICTNRYNEPFCSPSLYINYVSYMFERLKNNHVVIGCNTNGDFLSDSIIEKVIPFLHHITISLYDKNLVESTLFVRNIFKNGKEIKDFDLRKETSEIIFTYKNTKVIVKFNRNETIKDIVRTRGSILHTEYVRKDLCSVIGNMIAIDLDGTISPCCDLYKGNPEHQNVFTDINIMKYNNNDELFGKISTEFELFKKFTLKNRTCIHCSSTENNSMGSKIIDKKV